jgi:hypothetical protein
MAKKSAPTAAPASEPDSLALAVDRLTGELSTLRQVLDEIREDFSWLTRNGLPVQPIEHVHVKRMALDPCADDWGERLEMERSTYHPRCAASPLDSEAIDHIADDLKVTMEAVAQGQLEIVLTALDGVRAEILTVLKRRRIDPTGESAVASEPSSASSSSSRSSSSSSSPPPADSTPKPAPGRLF